MRLLVHRRIVYKLSFQFENEYVKRIFINQHRIERTFLANTRKEGEQIAESLGGGTAMTADLMRVQVQRLVESARLLITLTKYPGVEATIRYLFDQFVRAIGRQSFSHVAI